MKKIPENLMVEILDRLDAGEPAERLLREYPSYSDEIQLMIETTEKLKKFSVQSNTGTQQQSKMAFLKLAENLKTEKPQKTWFTQSYLHRLVLPTAAIILLFFISGIICLTASAKALPGDPLYGTKILVEQFRLKFSNPVKANVLQESFHQERIREIVVLVHNNREALISFDGIISFISEKQWVVSDLPMIIADTIEIDGNPFVGAKAQINGHIRGGILYADHISILTDLLSTLEPTVTTTNTPTATPTIMPSATRTPINASLTPTQTEELEDDDPEDPEETMEPTEIEETEEDDEDDPEFTPTPEPTDEFEDGEKEDRDPPDR